VLVVDFLSHIFGVTCVFVLITIQRETNIFYLQVGLNHQIYIFFIMMFYFKGFAFETLGPWCKEANDFINVIGNRLIAESGD
jgi:hypothetical protein